MAPPVRWPVKRIFNMTQAMSESLDLLAEERNIPVAEIIREALDQYLVDNKPKRKRR